MSSSAEWHLPDEQVFLFIKSAVEIWALEEMVKSAVMETSSFYRVLDIDFRKS